MDERGTTWYRFIRWLAKNLAFAAWGGLRSEGNEQIPTTGPVIMAPVHVSHLDPPAVACGMERAITFMAKEELFKPPIFGPLIRSLGAFPVRRGKSDLEAIKFAIELLQQGRAVLVFPEGQRGDGVTLGEPNTGISMLAKRTGAPVIPVGVVGTHLAFGKGRKPKRNRMKVLYGAPIRFEEVCQGMPDREARTYFAQYVMERIAELCRAGGLTVTTAPCRTPQGESPAAPEKSTVAEYPGGA